MKKIHILLIALFTVSAISKADDDFGYTKSPDTSTSDANYPVESFGGTFDVSSLGAATYTVPIGVPVGVGGMQPNLSITYNSQSSFGLAGLGFNLSGLSSITRGPKSVWQDGVSSGITFDSDCALYLDGERLIPEENGEYSLASNRLVRVRKAKIQREVSDKSESDYTVVELNGNKKTYKYYKYVYVFKVISADETISTYECLLPYTRNDKICEYSWVLTGMVDRLGNSMSIVYDVDDARSYIYPCKIVYGKNNGSFLNSVVIDYEELPSCEWRFFRFDDKVGTLTKKIVSITSLSNDVVYRKYFFHYDVLTVDKTNARVSKLRSIAVSCDGNDKDCPKINVEWGEEPQKFELKSIPLNIFPEQYTRYYELLGSRSFYAMDYNGDGISDIVEITPVSLMDGNGTKKNVFAIYASEKDRDGTLGYSQVKRLELPSSFAQESKSAFWYNKVTQTVSVNFSDFNGDGISDIFMPYYTTDTNNNEVYITCCFMYGNKNPSPNIIDKTDFISSSCLPEIKSTIGIPDVVLTSGMVYLLPGGKKKKMPDPPLYASFDIDNDGYGNYLILETYKDNEYGYRCYIGTPNSSGAFDKHVCFLQLSADPKSMFVGDYNCDGLIDIFVLTEQGYKFFYNQGKDEGYYGEGASLVGNSLKNHQIVKEGDFDGDGISDYFYMDAVDGEYIGTPTPWYIAYGSREHIGTFDTYKVVDMPIYRQGNAFSYDGKSKERSSVVVYDMDNDGKSDLFVSDVLNMAELTPYGPGTYSYPAIRTIALRSTGVRADYLCMCEDKGIHYERIVKSENANDYGTNMLLGDFDGDGNLDLCHYNRTQMKSLVDGRIVDENTFVMYSFIRNDDYRKINKISDALGNSIEIKYKTLVNSDCYTNGQCRQFPLVDLTMPLSVVASITRSNGVLPSSRVEYQYKGLKYHSQGRGVLGFDEITSENKVQKYDGSFAPKSKVVNSVESYDPQFYTPTKMTTDTYAWIGVENKYELYNSSSVEYQTDAVGDKGNYFHHPIRKAVTDLYGHTSYIDYVYDAQNYVLQSEDAYSDDGLYKGVVYLYPAMKDKKYKGALKPYEIQTGQTHADDKNHLYCVKTKLEYDENGLLVKKIDNYGTDKALTTSMIYDYVGNVYETKVSGSDVKTKIVSNVYDHSNRFLTLTFTEYAETANAATFHKYDKWGHCIYTANFDNFDLDNYDENSTEEDIVGATSFVRNEYDSWGNLVRSVDTFGNVKTISKGWGDSQEKKYYVLTQGTHTPWIKIWYDSMGREVETESVGAKDIIIKTTTKYDELGNVVVRESIVGDRKVTETITYDDYNRVVKTESSTGEVTTTTYDDRSVAVTTGKKTVTKTLDSWGNPKSVNDGFCEITYTYNSNGQPSEINAGGDVTTFEYDEVGNKISMKTSDKGEITYKYNCLGECVYTKDAVSVTQNTQYDELGRVIEKKVGTQTIKYKYGTSGSEANKLTSKSLSDVSGKMLSMTNYSYDDYGRVSQEDRLGKSGNGYRTEYEYNEYGELQKTSYWISEKNISVSTDNKYDCYGNKVEVYCTDYTLERKPIWRLHEYTGKKVGLQLIGCDGVESESVIDDAGRLCSCIVSWRYFSRKTMGYSYNPRTGNMKTRTGMLDKTETFDYDDYDRLTKYLSLDGSPQVIDYSGNGNITEKSDYGTYDYSHSTKPHRLTGLNNEAGACPLDTRQITYNAWNRVSKIKDSGSGYEMLFEYDEDGNRNWSKLTKNGAFVRETEYIGNMEHVRTTSGDDYFIYLGDNLMYHFNNHVGECLYLCTDHLGSVIGIIDEQGEMCYDAKYDAWGNQEVVKNDIGFIRGYTGHEEMPEFGLINMNARLYDPMLGRFLSPDDYVQMPENSQNFNRYAYCVNNPLKYSDPSGNFIQWGMVALAAYTQGLISFAKGDTFVGGALEGAVMNIESQAICLIGSCVTASVGNAMGHNLGSVWNEALRAGCHGLAKGSLDAITDGDFKTGFIAGFTSSIVGSATQFGWKDCEFSLASMVLSGGLSTLITDRGGCSFIHGTMIGFEIGTLNHCGGENDGKRKKSAADRYREALESSLDAHIMSFEKLNESGVRIGADGHLYQMPKGRFGKKNFYLSSGDKVSVRKFNTSGLKSARAVLKGAGRVAEAGEIFCLVNENGLGAETQKYIFVKACGMAGGKIGSAIVVGLTGSCTGPLSCILIPVASAAGNAIGSYAGEWAGEYVYDTFMK